MLRQPQALLLTGPPGIGKSELATELAAAMLCERAGGVRPACADCPACYWFSQNNHPDFRRLTPILDDGKAKGESAFEIKIGQIRELADFVATGAHRAGKRIVLLDPADALNAIAANALLKTLEEPTKDLHFLLVSSSFQRLPATLRSRCLRYSVHAPDRSRVLHWLSEQTTIPAPQIATALNVAAGSPRGALALLDPTRKAGYDAALALIAALPEADLLSSADRLTSIDARLWLALLRRWTVDIARVLAGSAPQTFVDQSARLAKLAQNTDFERLSAVSARLDRQSAWLSRPLNPRLYCESVLFDYLGAFKT